MTDEFEISDRQGRRWRMAMPGDRAVVGSGDAADVRLDLDGLAPAHFRLVRIAGGVRIEPVRAGGTLAIDGEDLFCKDLRAGGTADVEGLHLVWHGGGAPAAAPRSPRTGVAPRPSARRAAPPRRAEAGPRGRSRARSAWLPLAMLVGSLLLVVLFVVQRLGRSTWPESPQHFVDLAAAQLANGNPQRALDTLAFALREATGPTRDQALELEQRIRRMLLEVAEAPLLRSARQEFELLQSFVARYLGDRGERAPARELVRLVDQWLERHRDVCARHDEGRGVLQAVEALRARHAPAAALAEPDTAADAIFAAQSRLRFQWRDYREAFRRLDAFLAAHPGDAAVTAERVRMLADGEAWLQQRLRNLDLLLDRGDSRNAELDLQQLERWSLVPEWEPLVAPRRERLAAGR